MPGLLLSEAAGRSTRAQLEEALAAAQAKLHPVHLHDVRPVCLGSHAFRVPGASVNGLQCRFACAL